MKRVEKFLKEEVCPDCCGTRLSPAARAPKLRGIGLDEACTMTLGELVRWVAGIPGSLPPEMRPMAERICASFQSTAKRLIDLGLGYLSLDRAASTLSTGERQRMQLARAVRNRTCGVLYVLDEPSIGLHPANIAGLTESCGIWWPTAIQWYWWITTPRYSPRRTGSSRWARGGDRGRQRHRPGHRGRSGRPAGISDRPLPLRPGQPTEERRVRRPV